MIRQKILAGLLIVLLCVASVLMARCVFFPRVKFTADAMALIRSKGERTAPLWIVEYSDYQCPSCRVASGLIKETLQKYPSKIYFQARFYPLIKHVYGLKAAIYTECAARQGKFWEFHDLLFEKQLKWSEVSTDQIDPLFESYAQSVGINVKKLASCVQDPRTKKRVLDEVSAAKSMGVNLTPTFFINGKMAAGIEAFKEELDRELNKTPSRGTK